MASLVKNGETYGLIWTVSGEQCRESLKTTNYQKAKQRKAWLEDQFYDGEHDPFEKKWYERKKETNRTSLKAKVEEFIKFKTRARGQQGWSQSVAKRETYVMRKFSRHVGGKLKDLTDSDLEDFYYRDSVNSEHTRNGDYISVNTFLNWCITKGYLESKPEFKPKKPQSKIPKFIYPEQLAELIHYRLQVIEGDWKSGQLKIKERGAYWCVLGWMVLAGTGLRPVELANLKLRHVQKDSIIIGEDFTTKVRSERTVPLLYESKQAVDILTDSNFRKLEPSMKGSEYLLGRKPSYAKKQLSYDFTETWELFFSDKPKRTLYNLKDTFAVRFLYDGSGRALNDLADILGHASLDTTRRYLKAVPYGATVEGTIWDH